MSTSGWKINTGILCVNVHLQEREKQNALSQGSSSFSLEQLSNTCLTSLDFLILVLHVKSVDPSMNKKQEEGRIVVRTSAVCLRHKYICILSSPRLWDQIFSLLDSSNYWFTQIGPLHCLMHNLVSFKTKLTDGRCFLPAVTVCNRVEK